MFKLNIFYLHIFDKLLINIVIWFDFGGVLNYNIIIIAYNITKDLAKYKG